MAKAKNVIDYLPGDCVSALAVVKSGITWTGLFMNEKHRMLGEKIVLDGIVEEMRIANSKSWCFVGTDFRS